MLTLSEANKYSLDELYRGIVEESMRISHVPRLLPFEESVGLTHKYLRENAASTAAFYSENEDWQESTPTVTEVTVSLKILGTFADVDNFLKATRANLIDIEGEIIAEKSKRMMFTFLDEYYYGNTTVNAKGFTGLHGLVVSANSIAQGSGTTAQALSIGNLDDALDRIVGEAPDVMVTTKPLRRRINAYLRANGMLIQDRDKWGDMFTAYRVPLYVDDSLVATELLASGAYSAKTGGAGNTCSLFVIRYGRNGVFGIQNGSSIEVIRHGPLEKKDAMRFKLRWYCSVGLYMTMGLSRISGIADNLAVVS